MNKNSLSFWMTVAGTACWGLCFLWMRRLSIKQNALLDQLREQGQRIERLSKIEHDLIKEVHPQVNEIREGMDQMMAAVKEKLNTPSSCADKEETMVRQAGRKLTIERVNADHRFERSQSESAVLSRCKTVTNSVTWGEHLMAPAMLISLVLRDERE